MQALDILVQTGSSLSDDESIVKEFEKRKIEVTKTENSFKISV